MSIQKFNINKGYSIFSERNYKTRRHAHYAIEIVKCSEGSFSITTNNSNNVNLRSVIIPANLYHNFDCIGAQCELLFADPLSETGKYFLQRYDLASRKDILVNPPLDEFIVDGTFDISLILQKAASAFYPKLDYRITKCIETINSIITNEEISVAQLAKESFLSGSRLAHLFKKQLGISVHQCILWRKIVTAALKSREGYSLTESAHFAGFADSSHFNKVFYKMFGINPFFVLKD